jgi:CheY-like chemotaxis protein
MSDAQRADADASEPRAGAAMRILVADDSLDAAESIGMLLGLRGHDVRLAHTGRQAIELSASYRPDVILLDISLPDMSGFEVAEALRSASSDAPPVLVAVTGFGRETDHQRAREAGIDLMLTKPVEPARLMELLNGLGESRTIPDSDR